MCEVTVAIANLQSEQNIEKCLLSAINQDFKEMEILVCDNCPNELSTAVIDGICSKHHRGSIVRRIHLEKSVGLVAIRNACIDHARGKYLLFLDESDSIPENAVSVLYKRMQESHADMVMGNWEYIKDEKDNLARRKTIVTEFMPDLVHCQYAIAEWMRKRHSADYPLSISNKLFNRAFLVSNLIRCIPSHGPVDDVYFSFNMILRVRKMAVVGDVTMCGRMIGGSAWNNDVGVGEMNIYLDVFDALIQDFSDMEQEKENDLLEVMKIALTKPFISGCLTENILNSKRISHKQKKQYLLHISGIACIGLKKDFFPHQLDKLCYRALCNGHNIYVMEFLFWCTHHKIVC